MQQIILLHGAIGAKDQLLFLSEALQQKDFKPYMFSFSGHGQMPFVTNFGIEQFAKELEQFIEENRLQAAHVFGYSMGGFVALYLAAQNPNLIGRIATLATKFDWNPESSVKEAAMLNPETIEEKVPKFAAQLKERHGEDWIQLLNKTATMMQALGHAPLLSDAVLKSIECPVLLGLGDKDSMVSLEETRNVFAMLPNATMYMLPKTKHPIEGVNIPLLATILVDFFTKS